MDTRDICLDLLGPTGLLHRPLGLYPDGIRPIEESHLPQGLADPGVAHMARFCFRMDQGNSQSIHFAVYGLDGQPPKERFFSSWPEMVALWRRKLSGSAPAGRAAKDPNAYLYSSGVERRGDDGKAPLSLRWGFTHTLSSVMGARRAQELAEAELMAGLLAIAAEGWMAIPLGRFEGPDADHEAGASQLAKERLSLSLASKGSSPASSPRPRL